MQFKVKIVSEGKTVIHPTRFSYPEAEEFIKQMSIASPKAAHYTIVSFSPIWDLAIHEGLYADEASVDALLARSSP
jgi:hypothetical protein